MAGEIDGCGIWRYVPLQPSARRSHASNMLLSNSVGRELLHNIELQAARHSRGVQTKGY